MKYFAFRDDLNSIIETMTIQSQHKNLDFSFFVDKNVPKKILSDNSRISQVLFSLLGNAVKYTTAGTISLKIEKILS